MPFDFERLDIPEVILVRPKVFEDERGFFLETYKQSAFSRAGIPQGFAQDNHSRSVEGVLRGLHFQKPPVAQGKLVRAIRGEIFDVAVDLRQGSPTYARWVGVVLSESNKHMLFVPEGFAHGFLVLSSRAEIAYKVTAEYSPEHDAGVAWDDPEIGVRWPRTKPILSEKDMALPRLRDADPGFRYTEEAE